MRAKLDKKYKFIYITQNKLTNQSYVGFHATDNIDDKYLGSGKHLKRSIRKYGRENFTRRILEHCNKNDWESREIFWIKEKNTFTPNGFNLTHGGEGGNGKKHNILTKQKISKSRIERGIATGKNNPTFDHTTYNFFNTKSKKKFVGYKFDLAQEINSTSSHLNAVIKGRRKHHKNCILI